tara:strand:+ start:391 stop:738 length:348 start_codon:yes stop_codon:yes gene_type:complete
MGYTFTENVNMCKFNDKGFIYRLIEMDEIIPWDLIDIKFDADLYDGDTKYIGMTSNPVKRGSDHRTTKGRKVMMQIIMSCGCETEARFHESRLLWEFKQKTGDIPKLNKSGWSGA